MSTRAQAITSTMLAFTVGPLCAVAAAQSVSVSKTVGPFSLQADGGGASVSGDLRTTLSAVAGDDNADWLTRVRGGYDYHSDGDSRFWAETIQPLSTFGQSTIFWQGRLSHALDDQTINTGLGYRWLSPSNNLLLGVNAFYDHSFDAGHDRVSIGGEALGPFFSLRANVYDAVSGWEDLGGGVREHALGGADVTLDSQAPYMPWLRVGARYFVWNGIAAYDAKGLQGTLSADITDQFQVVGAYAGDEDPEGEYYLGVRLRLKGGSKQPTAVDEFLSSEPLKARDLSTQKLAFVERENRIITESQGGAYASGSITVSRSE